MKLSERKRFVLAAILSYATSNLDEINAALWNGGELGNSILINPGDLVRERAGNTMAPAEIHELQEMLWDESEVMDDDEAPSVEEVLELCSGYERPPVSDALLIFRALEAKNGS
jgi:hypothetical protein